MSEQWIDLSQCDGRTFRGMLGSFMTGVTVVATREVGGQNRAFTANSFTSLSLDPPLVLVCLAKTSPSLSAFSEAPSFSISVLGEWQRELSNSFASRDVSVKAQALNELKGDIVPFVQNSIAAMICDREEILEGGDHVILVGRVTRFATNDGQPLGYFRGSYVGLGPVMRDIEKLGTPFMIGGVLGFGDKVMLLRRSAGDQWELPQTALQPGERHGEALHRLFSVLGIRIDETVPYSLFQEVDDYRTTCIFSVRTAEPLHSTALRDGVEIAFFGAHDQPWELISGDMKQGLLKRYFREIETGMPGVYFDTLNGGSVVPVSGKSHSWTDWQLQK